LNQYFNIYIIFLFETQIYKKPHFLIFKFKQYNCQVKNYLFKFCKDSYIKLKVLLIEFPLFQYLLIKNQM